MGRDPVRVGGGGGCTATLGPWEENSERVSPLHKDLPLPHLPPRTSWKEPEPLRSKLRPQTVLDSPTFPNVSLGRGCQDWKSRDQGMQLPTTWDGAMGRDSIQSPGGEPEGHRERTLLQSRQLGLSSRRGQTGWDQKEVQQAWTAGGQAGQASRDATRWAVVPRGGHVLLALSGRARERHLFASSI